MSLTSMYPLKKKRKRTTDKTPVRRTRRNWDADSPMAASMLGTPSPNNSSIDADKDIVWDNCSPTQHLPIRRRNQGRPGVSDIAQFIKLVPAENASNVQQNLPPLLGLWMERGHDLLTENLKSSSNQPKRNIKGRKTRSKVGHLKSEVFSSELCKLAKMMESRQDSPQAAEKQLKSKSNRPQEDPINSRTSTPNREQEINCINKRKSLNASSELWGQDEWYEDESFLRQATQIEHDVCSQVYNDENHSDTTTVTEVISTERERPKTYLYKTPVTRKMKRGKNLSSGRKVKKSETKNKFETDRVNKTEKVKPVCSVPTLALKPRQLHGTFQNVFLRVKSEDIVIAPTIDILDDEVWDDLDDNELAGLESVLDTGSCMVLENKPECQKSNRVVPSRKCFRFKSSTQADGVNQVDKNPGGDLNRQLAFPNILSPVTRSMTRGRNNRTKKHEATSSNDVAATNNNNAQCSQEQIEKKRLLAIQRRKQRNQNLPNTARNMAR